LFHYLLITLSLAPTDEVCRRRLTASLNVLIQIRLPRLSIVTQIDRKLETQHSPQQRDGEGGIIIGGSA